MAKRGAVPKGEYVGKSAVLSTRITPDLREGLQNAANKSGRSLSQEIEYRLRRSFGEDQKISDLFGSDSIFILVRMIALSLQAPNP
jgi:hypothetical protein